MADMEVGGVKFSGFGKIGIAVTALSTLAGSAYVGYEFYFDYLDLREVVQEIDIDEIKAQNELVLTKLDWWLNVSPFHKFLTIPALTKRKCPVG